MSEHRIASHLAQFNKYTNHWTSKTFAVQYFVWTRCNLLSYLLLCHALFFNVIFVVFRLNLMLDAYACLLFSLTHILTFTTAKRIDEKRQRERGRTRERKERENRGCLRSTHTFCYSCFCWLPSLPAHYRMFLIIVSNSSSLLPLLLCHFLSSFYFYFLRQAIADWLSEWAANEWMRVLTLASHHPFLNIKMTEWILAAIRLSRRRLSNSGIPALFGRNTNCASHLFISFFLLFHAPIVISLSLTWNRQTVSFYMQTKNSICSKPTEPPMYRRHRVKPVNDDD